jgi:acyl carrier protein
MDALKQIFSSVLGIDPEKVVPGLSPENTPSWDSLNAIVLITEIEKAFNVKFDYTEAMAVKNFADVVSLVKSKTREFHG